MQTSTILLIVVAVLVVAAAGWFLYHLQRSTQLRRRFGPEYERTLPKQAIAERRNPTWSGGRNDSRDWRSGR